MTILFGVTAYLLFCLWIGERLRNRGLQEDIARLRHSIEYERELTDKALAMLGGER